MTQLLPAQIAAMVERRAAFRSLLIRIATTTPTRFWTGFGPLKLDVADDLDPASTFNGAGVMKTMPSLRQITDGKAERVDFEFFASHPQVVAMVAQGIEDVDINVGYVFFNPDWSLAGPAAWLWSGVLDAPRRRQAGLSDRRILSAYSGTASRRRAGRKYWTNAGHLSRHPGDTICAGMSLMTGHDNVSWP